ncbi:hypothetical protein SASPL_131584 [Salvia splendens]|uniref:Uncharacterized protein n=1 Tax=Salvia splendens TaxID=180675 RepID=A0A8X8ZLQ5_SALSN|nr:hypothetical protein SASPL_131584 [Salvia splendens]
MSTCKRFRSIAPQYIKDMESNAKQQEKLALQASLFFDNCKSGSDNCRKELQDAKRYAESVAIITPELQQAFLEMPTTVEELEAAIQDTITQPNGILFLNHNILEEYENRQRKIEALTNKQEADVKELKSLLDEIDALKVKSWINIKAFCNFNFMSSICRSVLFQPFSTSLTNCPFRVVDEINQVWSGGEN